MAQTDAVRQSGTGARARHRMLVGPIIGPPKLRFFCICLHFFYHICKMKWPEFEAKIKIGGLEKLGEWCAPPPVANVLQRHWWHVKRSLPASQLLGHFLPGRPLVDMSSKPF